MRPEKEKPMNEEASDPERNRSWVNLLELIAERVEANHVPETLIIFSKLPVVWPVAHRARIIADE